MTINKRTKQLLGEIQLKNAAKLLGGELLEQQIFNSRGETQIRYILTIEQSY